MLSNVVNAMCLAVTETSINSGSFECAANSGADGVAVPLFLQQWLTPSPQFELVTAQSENRDLVEKYIERQFKASYGAKLADFLPLFLTLSCVDQLSASAGISLGCDSQKFFLEQYLDQPIERELKKITKENINRRQLVEIGNLVATSRGASRLMLIILASVLSQAGYDWMVFTATKPLLNSLHKLRFETHVIAEAKPTRLDNNSNADWGSYYDNQPKVVAGRLSSAQQVVADRGLFNSVQGFYKNKVDFIASEITQINHSYA